MNRALEIGLSSALLSMHIASAHAQILPDVTLGNEHSAVISGAVVEETPVDLIVGGAQRGSNLFHSFVEFNVNEGQQVYFANPHTVQSILSRVTGNNPSHISGLLGVDGPADLFFLNPNGIIFGENASLDISGSFYGTTADAIALGETAYSAREPYNSGLLTVAPETVFFNYLTPGSGDIVSTAHLTADGNLILAGRNLQIQNQLMAGENLSLLALDTVTVRDTPTEAFISQAGQDLTIQGNQGIDILTLNHLSQTPFASGRHLALRSDGIISGDAHFTSDGMFSIESVSGELASFISLHDPIISAVGDVNIASDYIGASLLIESQGDVQIQGDIDITTPDIISNFIGDDTVLSLLPGLIIRSGQSSLRYGGVTPTLAIQPVPDGITVLGEIVTPGGPVLLTAETGDINVQSITTTDSTGGDISLIAEGDILTNALTTGSVSFLGNSADGGQITLVSNDGNIINNGPLTSSSLALTGDAGNGGKISLSSASGDIINNAFIQSNSVSILGSAGDGGEIAISSTSGDINNNDTLSSESSALSQNAGNGGLITLSSISGNITNNAISSGTAAINGNTGNGGTVSISSTTGNITNNSINASASSTGGDAGNGGRILISSTAGNILNSNSLDSISISRDGVSGNGGDISISSTSGSIQNIQPITSSSQSDFSNSGDGGSITITSESSDINNFSLDSSTFSPNGDAGDGGDISVSSLSGNIVNGILFSSSASDSGDSRNGGDISVSSLSGNINNNLISSLSISSQGDAGNGGDIAITSNSGNIINENVIFPDSNSSLSSSSASINGNAGNGGSIIIFSSTGDITNSLPLASNSASVFGNTGDGGLISVSSINGDILNEDILLSFSVSGIDGDSGNGGAISILSRTGDISIDTSTSIFGDFLSSNSGAGNGNAGNGGPIAIATEMGDVLIDTDIVSASISAFGISGNGGGISVAANQGDILAENSQLITASVVETGEFSGAGGSVNLTAQNSIAGVTILTVSSAGKSGDINIQGLGDLLLQDIQLITSGQFQIPNPGNLDSTITINLDELGQSGNVTITSLGDLTLENLTLQSDANGSAAAGNITVFNADNVQLNNSQILSDTNASGQGGNISFTNLESLTFDNSILSTDTAGLGGSAGNILIENVGILLLGNDSLLLSDAANLSDGGDINVNTDFVIAIPDENSDIIVNAIEGSGGDVNITATGVYGFTTQTDATTPDLRANGSSDISASSQFGQPGIVAISVIDIDPSQELEELSNDFVSPDSLVASSCISRSSDADSSFVILGREDLPQQLNDSVSSTYSTNIVQTVNTDVITSAIQEPEAAYQLSDGRLVLSHPCSEP